MYFFLFFPRLIVLQWLCNHMIVNHPGEIPQVWPTVHSFHQWAGQWVDVSCGDLPVSATYSNFFSESFQILTMISPPRCDNRGILSDQWNRGKHCLLTCSCISQRIFCLRDVFYQKLLRNHSKFQTTWHTIKKNQLSYPAKTFNPIIVRHTGSGYVYSTFIQIYRLLPA